MKKSESGCWRDETGMKILFWGFTFQFDRLHCVIALSWKFSPKASPSSKKKKHPTLSERGWIKKTNVNFNLTKTINRLEKSNNN